MIEAAEVLFTQMIQDSELVRLMDGIEHIHSGPLRPDQSTGPEITMDFIGTAVRGQKGSIQEYSVIFTLHHDTSLGRSGDPELSKGVNQRIKALFDSFSSSDIENYTRMDVKLELPPDPAVFEANDVPYLGYNMNYEMRVQ